LGIFGVLGLSYEFLFITTRTLCRYVCELASSSDIRLCLCAHEYPAMLSQRKELMLFYYVSGNVLILEFNLNGDPPINMSSPSIYILPKTVVLKRVEALRYS
jgi:hypothetical protein